MRADSKWLRTKIAFDLGVAGQWGLIIDSGVAAATGRRVDDPDVRIRTSPRVLTEIYEGRRPGYEAFLDGELEVRGNLALALELESMFEPAAEQPPDWPRTSHVSAGKVRWSVLEAGPPEGNAVVLLHGLGSSKVSFLTSVRALSRDFRVLAVDLPGFGDSAKPVAPYDAGWFADRVVDLLDAMEIKQAGFVGNSMGGRICLEIGLRHAERARGLVLLCPALAFLRFRQAAPVVRLLRPELSLIPVKPRRSTVITVMRSIMAHPDRVPAVWYEAAADEFFRVYAKPRGRMAFYAAARQIYLDEPHGEKGFWQRLRALDVPSAFVFGRHDPLIPTAFATSVREALPDARVEIFDDCGHVPQIEEPDRTHELVAALLA